MEIISLSSGSSGNCILIKYNKTHILVDIGISAKKVEQKLEEIGLDGTDINAILLTHEHKDHVIGLETFVRRYGMPVYASHGTIRALSESVGHKSIPGIYMSPFERNTRFTIGDIEALPFATPHDAQEPMSYRFEAGEKSCAVVTDMGSFDYDITNKLNGLDAIYIEANHDENVLSVGAYPYFLKKRILSGEGHLSNNDCARLLCEIYSPKLKYIMLGHLSKNNNLPELAYETVRSELLLNCDGFYLNKSEIKVALDDKICCMSF